MSPVYERLFRPAMTRLAGSPGYRDEQQWLQQRFRPAAGPLLDLACGTGRYTRMLAGWFDVPVIGSDISQPMLRQAARSSRPGVRFIRASAQDLPFGDGSLGGVVCFGALHLFPDPAGAIAEIGRVLRPGGCLCCLTCWESPRRRLHQFAAARLTRIRFLPRDEIEDALSLAGMEIKAFEDRGLMAAFAARRRD